MKEFFENSKPQLNMDLIKTFEGFVNIKFPKDYINFLIHINGGVSRKSIFFFPGTLDGSSTHHWFGFRSESYFSLLVKLRDRGIRFPINFIPICDDTFGNLILLSVKGPDYGKVYFWDHEQETEPADYSNLTLIADSFEEFINNLKTPEDAGLEE
jgi:hypothetical protein